MKNLKLFSIVLICLVTNFSIVNAESTWDIVEDQIKNNTPIVKKLSTCTNAGGKYYSIYGLENGKCHFETEIAKCYAPVDVVKKYSDSLLKAYSKMLSTHEVFVFDSNAEYVDMVHEKYCTYK